MAYEGGEACSCLLICRLVVLLALGSFEQVSFTWADTVDVGGGDGPTCFFTDPRKPPKRAAHGLLDIAL